MDGARLMNAATALDVGPADIVQYCDSVTMCFSKGLGAPVGSVMAGTKDFIIKARRIRKLLGGGMRQAGVLAAAGMTAIDETVPLLKQDHKHAKQLAEAISSAIQKADIGHLVQLDPIDVHSNIVILHFPGTLTTAQWCDRLAKVTDQENGDLGESISVLMWPAFEKTKARFVLYRDISTNDVELAKKKFVYVINELTKT